MKKKRKITLEQGEEKLYKFIVTKCRFSLYLISKMKNASHYIRTKNN